MEILESAGEKILSVCAVETPNTTWDDQKKASNDKEHFPYINRHCTTLERYEILQ